MAYPTDEGQTYVDVTLNDVRGENQADGLNHATRHNKIQEEITALKDKVGIDGDSDTDSLDYKVSEITSTDTAVGKSATQTLTNKTIDGDSNTISNLDLGNEVDWAAASDVADASAFESGDKVLVFEAGVGMRKVDYDDLPGDALADGDKGDITVSSLGATWTVDNDAISNAKLANMAGHTVKAKIDGSSGDPTDLAVGSHGIVGRNSGDIISIDAGTNSVLRRNTGNTLQFGKIGSNHLETEVTDSLDLADSALQSGDIGVSIQAYDSNLGTQIMTLRCDRLSQYDDDNTVKVADGVEYLPIPASMNGMNLISAHAYVITAGTTNTTDIQIHNLTDNVDMLSTKITIDSGETSSRTAAVAPVIDTANDDVATGDILRIDVDAVSTTAPKDLYVQLEFKKS